MAFKQVVSDFHLDHSKPHSMCEIIDGRSVDGMTRVYAACGAVSVGLLLERHRGLIQTAGVVVHTEVGIEPAFASDLPAPASIPANAEMTDAVQLPNAQ